VVRTAAIITVGSELTQGLRIDTNTAEIARALAPRGFRVSEAVSVADDVDELAGEIGRLSAIRDLVITTGGLGPTHDDITREAAAAALGVELVPDPRLLQLLEPVQKRHHDSAARQQVLTQAQVLRGAEIIDFSTGTAPGLVAGTESGGVLALLPGPPSEMRPMLEVVLDRYAVVATPPRELGVVGLPESDIQVVVERSIAGLSGVGFTILARPGDVRVILTDAGCGPETLATAAHLAATALGDNCYSTDGASLGQVVIREAARRRLTIAVAESCTGGMVGAALTDPPGASEVFLGAVVSYSNESKRDLLGVAPELLAACGAVSAEVVDAMALGAYEAFGRPDLVVSVSGVAGPGGGSPDKPVGTVWFGVLSSVAKVGEGEARGVHFRRDMPGSSRDAVRARAASIALDSLRRAVLGLPGAK